MPIPIRPMNNNRNEPQESSTFLDYSFLATQVPSIQQNKKKTVTASNKDADLLMKIWLEADNKGNKIDLSNLNLSSRDIMRLKTYGLIKGSSSEVEFTDRGKKVITVMALGEGNKFERGKSEKSYMEILASMDMKGKSGYRIPKFCSNTSNNMNVKDAFQK